MHISKLNIILNSSIDSNFVFHIQSATMFTKPWQNFI